MLSRPTSGSTTSSVPLHLLSCKPWNQCNTTSCKPWNQCNNAVLQAVGPRGSLGAKPGQAVDDPVERPCLSQWRWLRGRVAQRTQLRHQTCGYRVADRVPCLVEAGVEQQQVHMLTILPATSSPLDIACQTVQFYVAVFRVLQEKCCSPSPVPPAARFMKAPPAACHSVCVLTDRVNTTAF